MRLVRPFQSHDALAPVVVLMHPTQSDVDGVAEKAGDLARRGFLAVCMDCRYHGARSGPSAARRDPAAYQRALVAAWRGSGERPFLLDNVRDLLTLADYLELHGPGLGADPARLGVTGVSLGGMHSWLWAVADTRVKAAAPIIGVQGFKCGGRVCVAGGMALVLFWVLRRNSTWQACSFKHTLCMPLHLFRYALENDCFHGRVSSLPILFAAAAKDLDPERQRITSAVVRAVWDKLLPGLLEEYDAPRSLPAIAPRSLLVVNGAQDPRCPIQVMRH